MTTYYELGGRPDPDRMIGYTDERSFFHWTVSRERFEVVITGNAGKHCETCQCSNGNAVIEDQNGTRYDRMQFAMQLGALRGETRTDS